MDEVNCVVAQGLEQALADSGLIQADFAAALGTSASRFSTYRTGKTMPTAAFYLRALRLASNLKAAREHGWMTPQSTAREVRRALRNGDEIWALKMVLQGRDHLRELLCEGDAAADAWRATPRSTGSRRWDALLAALADHEFEAAHREPPRWADDDGERLRDGDEWVLQSLLLDDEEIRAATPGWLSSRGIYAAERDLVTA